MYYLLGLDSWYKKALFWGYIFACSLQAILLHRPESGDVSVSRIVMMQELLKLFLSLLFLGIKLKNWKNIPKIILQNYKFFCLYLVPATLYSIYNNLAFSGLREFDPATYFVLMQFRIVLVSLCSVMFMGKKISNLQWFGLIAITIGASLKIADSSDSVSISFSSLLGPKFVPFVWLQIQLLCSVAAGLFNEYMLKTDSQKYPEIQNFYMYFDSIFVAIIGGSFSNLQGGKTISSNFSICIPIIVNGALMGLLTAYFLRTLDSVRKSIAAAIELWTTAIFSALMFGYPISGTTIAGLALITIGITLYSRPEKKNFRKK